MKSCKDEDKNSFGPYNDKTGQSALEQHQDWVTFITELPEK